MWTSHLFSSDCHVDQLDLLLIVGELHLSPPDLKPQPTFHLSPPLSYKKE